MAVTFHGADTTQLMDMSQRMRVSALRLQGIQREIVHGSIALDWTGADAEQFRDDAMTRVSDPITNVLDSSTAATFCSRRFLVFLQSRSGVQVARSS